MFGRGQIQYLVFVLLTFVVELQLLSFPDSRTPPSSFVSAFCTPGKTLLRALKTLSFFMRVAERLNISHVYLGDTFIRFDGCLSRIFS